MRNLVNVIGSAASGGVSSLLLHQDRSWEQIIFQQAKKPVDAEFNLLQQIAGERTRLLLRGIFGSGAAGIFVPAVGPGSNVVRIHTVSLMPFLVDGRIVMVGDPANSNRIDVQLTAPQGAGSRKDLVFLEVWYAEVQPTGSPEAASSTVYTNGGVGLATLSNDLIVIDAIESTRRIQLRWRLRVIDNVNDGTYPLGMSDPQVLGRGDAVAAVATKTFTQDTVDTGLWTAGAGIQADGVSFKCVDGYTYAIPVCFVTRSVGVTVIPANAVAILARTATATNADMVDGFHASATPTPGYLLPLDGTSKFPSTVIPSTIDADTVDTFHAASTPTASKLLPLDGSVKFPNSVLHTGTGNALDADTIDGFHAAATPVASKLLALDSGSKFPNSALKTGSGNGLDADKVDGYETSTLAGSAAYASRLLVLDSGGKFPNTALKTGAGNGLDADLLDGLHSNGFALSAHSHPVATGTQFTGYAGVTVSAAFAIVATLVVTVGVTGYSMLCVSIEEASATAITNQLQASVFVDGAEDFFFPDIVATVSFGGSRFMIGGMLLLTAGSRTITVRAKCLTAGQTITIGSVRMSLAGLSVT